MRSLLRRIFRTPRMRATLLRTLVREDEIVPFGSGLRFDPHSWLIKETDYGFRIWVALGERSISREIMLDRYERDEVTFVRSLVRSGDRVVDVGANIGFYTALLATLVGAAGRVIACEPLATVAEALERTLAENRFGDRVTVLRVALDARRGTASLRHAPVTINAGAAYLAPADELPPGHVDEQLPTLTLDDIIGDGPCRFVKLDAEGAEPRILAGAQRTLRHCRPVILSEFNPTLLERVGGRCADDVFGIVEAERYVVHRLRNGAPGERIRRYRDGESINVVFLPEP